MLCTLILASILVPPNQVSDIGKALKAQDLQAVVRLVKAGANPNWIEDFNGSIKLSPLVLAARDGDSAAIKLFISKGADVNLPTTRDWSPLSEACFNNHPEAAETLVAAGAEVNPKHTFLYPLDAAISGLCLKDRGPREPKRWELIRILIEHGADVNYRIGKGEPPVFATMDGHSPNATDVLQYLLDHGAHIEDQYPYIGTVLHRAAEFQDEKTIEFILSKGARIDARNERGETPIFFAVTENTPSVRVFLLHHGASLADRDNLGETPIFAAIRKVDADRVQWCIDHGADIFARNKKGRTPMKLLKSFKVEGLSTDSDNEFTEVRYKAVLRVLTRAKRRARQGQ